MGYKLSGTEGVVTRLSDNASIPNDPGNMDRAIYNEWLKTNKVLPEFTERELAQKAKDLCNVKAMATLLNIDMMTIRRARELLVAKFPTAVEIVSLEAQAAIERSKIT